MPSSSSSSSGSSSSASSSSTSSSAPKAKAAPAPRASVRAAQAAPRASTARPAPGRRSTAVARAPSYYDDYYSYYNYSSDYSRSPTPPPRRPSQRKSIRAGDAPRKSTLRTEEAPRSTLRTDDAPRRSVARPESRRESMDSQHDLDAMQREIDRLRSQHSSGKLTAPPAWSAAPPGYDMLYGSPYPGVAQPNFYPPPDPWHTTMMAPALDPWDYYHQMPPQPTGGPFPHHLGPFSAYMAPRQHEFSAMGVPYAYPPSHPAAYPPAAAGRYPSPFRRSPSPNRYPPYYPPQPFAPYHPVAPCFPEYPPHPMPGSFGLTHRASRAVPTGPSMLQRNLAQEDKFMRAVLLIQKFVRRWRARRRFRKVITEAKRLGTKAKPRKPVQTAAMSIQRWWRRKQEEEQENLYAPYQLAHVGNGGRLARPPPSWQSDNLEGAGSGKLGQLEAAQMLEQRMLQVMEEEARRRGGGAGPPGGFKQVRPPTRDVPHRRTAQEVADMLGLQREGPIPYQYRSAPPSRPGRERLPCAPRMVPGTPSTKASATDSDKVAMKLQALGEKFRTEAVQRMRHDWGPPM
mmetsp:Transcript_9862/g.22432  ORF Transcript_9862/g.22432 Transcript_9862/m.22432 type:complete len:570 (-) Transcript_9862:94-1803(-)